MSLGNPEVRFELLNYFSFELTFQSSVHFVYSSDVEFVNGKQNGRATFSGRPPADVGVSGVQQNLLAAHHAVQKRTRHLQRLQTKGKLDGFQILYFQIMILFILI